MSKDELCAALYAALQAREDELTELHRKCDELSAKLKAYEDGGEHSSCDAKYCPNRGERMNKE